ncbi:MAG: hypothetical protein O2970_10295 [Proteobacteria bacterium]|nr:hypothetical protein [Pseudomonadota bacterium]
MKAQKLSYTGLNVLGLGFSGYAAYEAFSLSALHLGGTPTCPVLFGIPACIIVLVCYILLTVAWGMALIGRKNKQAMIIFVSGFTPAFLLALIGSSGEVFGFASCPHTETGFPKCFISFGLLIGLALAWGLSMTLKIRAQ